MQLSEAQFGDVRPIDGYGPGFFRISGEVVEGRIWLTGTRQGPWGGYDDVTALIAMVPEVDVILIGTGAEIAHVPPAFRDRLEAAGLGLEVMATGPACRTFNVLLSEGRRIAAALVPV